MIMHFVRGLFILVIAAVIFIGITSGAIAQTDVFTVFIVALVLALVFLAADIFMPKQSLSAIFGVTFGLLIGMIIGWALGLVLDMVNNVFNINMSEEALRLSKAVLVVSVSYLVISLVMRTKDDIRFVIPYVEFSRQTKGMRPLVLDTSVIIDGRIADICQSRIFDAPLIVPRFVLNELQLVADSPDKLKRNRGRRGLDILHKMQSDPLIEVKIDDTPPPGIDLHAEVDQKLVAFVKSCDGKLITNDYNLNKVAQLREVDVININDLANALKTVVLPGEAMKVRVVKPGEEINQGIGYLDDGTMIVIEDGRDKIGDDIQISVTSALQTSAGRMIFGKYEHTIKAGNRNYYDKRRNDYPQEKREQPTQQQ